MLRDGREVITTTTLTTDAHGQVTQEVVTEVLESEEVTDEVRPLSFYQRVRGVKYCFVLSN